MTPSHLRVKYRTTRQLVLLDSNSFLNSLKDKLSLSLKELDSKLNHLLKERQVLAVVARKQLLSLLQLKLLLQS